MIKIDVPQDLPVTPPPPPPPAPKNDLFKKIIYTVGALISTSIFVTALTAAITASAPPASIVAATVALIAFFGFDLSISALAKKKLMASRYLLSIVQEVVYLAIAILTYPLGFFNFNPSIEQTRRALAKNNKIIFYVHGFGHCSAAALFHRFLLKRAGHMVYTINLGHPCQSIDSYAKKVIDKLSELAQELAKRHPIQINLVGHSMGGVVCKKVEQLYDQKPANNYKIDSILTMGSPLKGTKLAAIASCFPCSKEMMRRSTYLNWGEENQHRRYLHMGSETDLIIRPTSSATLEKAQGTYNNVQIRHFKCLSHLGYLYSPTVGNEIVKFYS